jgi:uncharacterized protein YqeY
MSLKDDLKKTLVEAAKAKDQVWLDAIRSALSAIQYKEKEKVNVGLTEAEMLSVIGTLCKQRRESIEQFQKGGRADLVAKETRELEILQKFLPAQASRGEIEKVIQKVIVEVGAKGPQDLGLVMKGAMKELTGKADGKLVNEVVRSLLK